MIGDGTGLPITHTGSISFHTPNTSFQLNNVLCVPTMKKNLISISQFCLSNNVSIEFSSSSFIVKELRTGATLLKGKTKDGVYEWPSSTPIHSPLLAFSSVKTTSSQWHHRLGHPASPILQHILSHYQINSSTSLSSDFLCNTCYCNKSHELSFSNSSIVSSRPLQIIFSDVWTSPVLSNHGFKYYVIFVDHFTKYIWFYPLKHKYEVKDVFIRFKAIVEKHFTLKICTLYSDNGGEYLALANFLAINGISHLTTPPHTLEHNVYSERRYRHIVETGLSLLTHASIRLTFWPQAFANATYLINRMPTPTLNLSSPFAKFFGTSPNYSKLRIFGCLCYPWLRPYSSHKLDARSKPCVFLGYSLTQSAYLCFHPPTSRTYVSRHVKFVESVFPFPKASTPSSPTQPDLMSTWIPQPLHVPLPAAASSPATSPSDVTPSVVQPIRQPLCVEPTHSTGSLTSATNTQSLPPNSTIIASSSNPPPLQITTSTPSTRQPTHTHTMITRAKNHISKPIQKLNLSTQLSPPTDIEPTTATQALKDQKWCRAKSQEYDALVRNGTWELVPPAFNCNTPKYTLVVSDMFRIK